MYGIKGSVIVHDWGVKIKCIYAALIQWSDIGKISSALVLPPLINEKLAINGNSYIKNFHHSPT